MTGDDVAIELWIDAETYDLLRVQVTEPESDDKEKSRHLGTQTLRVQQKVTIEPPV